MTGDLTGTRLGNYDIVRLLGKGGMGEVYLARHPMLQREVAVKVLKLALSQDEEALERFRREALTVNRIGHPTLVEVTDFGRLADERSYCVMSLLEGQSLAGLLEERGRLPLGEAVEILVPLLEGLEAAHAEGVVHRDVKPDNLFLHTGRKGERLPRILDFGIAKLLDPGTDSQVTQTGQLLGTPLYMSPEQAGGELKQIGPWSDVYSIGVVLYHMLVGRPPFVGDSFGAVLMHHLQSPPPSVRELRPELPEAVDQLIQRCLAKSPGARYPTMAALRADLLASAEQADAALAETVATRSSAPEPLRAAVLTPTPSPAAASLMTPTPAGLSSLSLAAAQQAGRPTTTARTAPTSRSPVVWILAVLLVAGAAAGGVWLWQKSRARSNTRPPPEPAAAEPPPAPDTRTREQLLPIARFRASSHLEPYREHRFDAKHLFDGRLDTCWQPRGSKTDSRGQWLKVFFKKPVVVTRVAVANGYQRRGRSGASPKVLDYFLLNSRLKDVTVHFSDYSSQRVHLADGRRGWTSVELVPRRTRWLQLTIQSIHPGSRWNDVALSELQFYGRP